MTVQHIPVAGGGIPNPPQGATVHQRGAAQPAAPAPAAPPAPAFEFQEPAAPAQPPAPAPAAPDSTIADLLAALSANQAAPAQPVAAPAPAQPVAAPVAGQDPVVSSLQAVLVSSGIDYDRALGRAMTEGDASLIDFAYIAEKGGANAAHLRQVAEGLLAHQTAVDSRLEQSVFSKFGGESNWDASLAYFAKHVPKSTVDYVAGMLQTRNPALIEQASNMIMDHVKQAGALLTPASTVHGQGGGLGEQPLGKDEFKREIAKLKPNSPGFEAERQQLFVRRHQGKQLGR